MPFADIDWTSTGAVGSGIAAITLVGGGVGAALKMFFTHLREKREAEAKARGVEQEAQKVEAETWRVYLKEQADAQRVHVKELVEKFDVTVKEMQADTSSQADRQRSDNRESIATLLTIQRAAFESINKLSDQVGQLGDAIGGLQGKGYHA